MNYPPEPSKTPKFRPSTPPPPPKPATTPQNQVIQAPSQGVDLDDLIEFLYSRARYLNPQQVLSLANLVFQLTGKDPRQPAQQAAAAVGSTIGGDFRLSDEVSKQISAMRALRDSVFNGTVITAETKEAKEALGAATTLLSLLVKLEKDVRTLERLRAIEAAVIEVLKDEDPGLREKLLRRMEERVGVGKDQD